MRSVKSTFVTVGLGQLGAAFSEAFLRMGHPVRPVLRSQCIEEACDEKTDLILVAVGEDDLSQVLRDIPENLRGRTVLIQNELRQEQWQNTWGPEVQPSVAIVWFEKKAGKLPHQVLPSVVSGPQTDVLLEAFEKLGLGARPVSSKAELNHELVLKNLYILSLNLCGLHSRGKAGELLSEFRTLFDAAVSELIELEEALILGADKAASPLDRQKLVSDLEAAILADPGHGCAGRSAPRRLERTLSHAERLGIQVPALRRLQKDLP